MYLYKFYKLKNIVAKKRRKKKILLKKKEKKRKVSIRHLPVFYPYNKHPTRVFLVV